MSLPVLKDRARIAGMFDAIAGRYGLLNHLLSAGLDRRWRAKAVQALRLSGRETVLDLCTGTADLAIAAVNGRDGRARRVIGVDFADAMLRLGHRKLISRSLESRVALVRGDATEIPLTTGSVDAAMIAFGIRNVEQPEAGCAEAYRVLKPGGRLAVLEFAVPRTPGVRQAYLWSFKHILPAIGRLVSRHSEAYSYLPASVGSFPAREGFLQVLTAAGFTGVAARPLTFGIVYLYTAVR